MKQKLLLLFGLTLLSTTLIECNTATNSSNNVTYQSAKMTLDQQEKATPLSYLKVTNGTYKQNIFNTWVIEGNITSTATVATYKDVVITVMFYTKTNTLLGSQDFQQYEFIKPGASIPFKIKSDGYKSTATIGVNIKNASVSN